MRTDDLLAISNHYCAADRRACERRSAVIGTIGAIGLVVMAWASVYSARPVQASAPNTYESELSAFAKAVERSGNLSGLEILW
jgi:threonine dehydrogenase-like Zn-dependent dehydrogenase